MPTLFLNNSMMSAARRRVNGWLIGVT